MPVCGDWRTIPVSVYVEHALRRVAFVQGELPVSCSLRGAPTHRQHLLVPGTRKLYNAATHREIFRADIALLSPLLCALMTAHFPLQTTYVLHTYPPTHEGETHPEKKTFLRLLVYESGRDRVYRP